MAERLLAFLILCMSMAAVQHVLRVCICVIVTKGQGVSSTRQLAPVPSMLHLTPAQRANLAVV